MGDAGHAPPIDVPRLHVDPAVWESGSGADRGSRLTAHLLLGDVALRLEATPVRGADAGRASAHSQATDICGRRYRVQAFRECERERQLSSV